MPDRWQVTWGHVGSLTLAALVLATGTATAQQSAPANRVEIRGVVTATEAGAPLPAVAVRADELGVEMLTDDAGAFVFRGVSPGTYTLRFSLVGRVQREERVLVEAGAAAVLSVALGPQAIALSPILVLHRRTRLVGDRALAGELPGSAHFVTREAMESRKLLFDDVHQVLREIPGVNIQEEEGFGLRANIGLRGTGSERSEKITVMEDGVLIAPAPYAAPAAYYFPVTGRMEAVEVRKGSSQIKYGPRTIGGALNLVSSPVPRDLHVDLDLGGGGHGTRKLRARAGDSYTHVGWMVETYQIDSDGFKRLDSGGSTGFRLQDYVGKLRLSSDPRRPGTYQEMELKLGYYDQRSHETYLGLTEQDFRSSPLRRYAGSQNDVMNADHRQAQLRYFVQPSQRFDVTATVYHNDFARNWYKLQSVGGRGLSDVLEDPNGFAAAMAILRGADSQDNTLGIRANNREYYSQGIQATAGLPLGAAHDLEIGVRYHRDQEDRFQNDDAYRMTNGRMVLTRRGAPGSQENRVNDASAWAFHVQDRVSLGALTLTPGLRYETMDFVRTDYARSDPTRSAAPTQRENSVDVWIPGVGVNYVLSPSLRLFGGMHRGFGAPGPGANPETETELSVNYELGASVRHGRLNGQLVGFFSDYENILGAATLATGTEGTGDLYNGGAVTVWGLEASAEYDVPAARARRLEIPIRVAYTLTDAEFRSSFTSQYEPWGTVSAGDELPYLARHQLYGTVGLAHASWNVRLGARYSSAMRTTAGQGPISAAAATDSFLVFDLSSEYSLTPWGALLVGIENLSNEQYVVARRPAGARPGLPRTIQTGLRVRY
ncbi:MAG: TonB-dependent receptor [Gemmatimonadetes bacterium]|nr:TonB-dependent receptor [Gemmatimonadota bacterium]